MFHTTTRQPKHSTHRSDWQDLFVSEQPAKRVVTARQTVAYERTKLAQSIHGVCMKAFGFSGEADATAVRVCQDVESWLLNKDEVTIADIKRHAAQALRAYNPRAAYKYLPLKEYRIKQDTYGAVRL